MATARERIDHLGDFTVGPRVLLLVAWAVPIDTAEETGLSRATRGAIRLPPVRMASIASGMPCPRIFSLP